MLSDSKNNKPPRPFSWLEPKNNVLPLFSDQGDYRDLSSAPQHGWLKAMESTEIEERGEVRQS